MTATRTPSTRLRSVVDDAPLIARYLGLEGVQTQLEALNERLEQFAYVASHDLKEPLRMVSSYLTLVGQRYAADLDEDGREFIEYAVDGADRMCAMIDGLLAYSRVETRGDPFEPINLDEVVAAVRKNLELRLEETDAELDVGRLPPSRSTRANCSNCFRTSSPTRLSTATRTTANRDRSNDALPSERSATPLENTPRAVMRLLTAV